MGILEWSARSSHEFMVRSCNQAHRRSWRKLYLGTDPKGFVMASEITGGNGERSSLLFARRTRKIRTCRSRKTIRSGLRAYEECVDAGVCSTLRDAACTFYDNVTDAEEVPTPMGASHLPVVCVAHAQRSRELTRPRARNSDPPFTSRSSLALNPLALAAGRRDALPLFLPCVLRHGCSTARYRPCSGLTMYEPETAQWIRRSARMCF